jgi:NADH:ubiquinone oxidoreductase subunit D
MKDDMESLIHHFKLFTEGYCLPEAMPAWIKVNSLLLALSSGRG